MLQNFMSDQADPPNQNCFTVMPCNRGTTWDPLEEQANRIGPGCLSTLDVSLIVFFNYKFGINYEILYLVEVYFIVY